MDRYLPIGSIVKIKGINYDVMITGYISVVYKDTVRIFDYKGCKYPEGLLSPNSNINFNHSHITTLVFEGYKNDEFVKMNTNLNQRNSKLSNETVTEEKPKYLFDENGVVISNSGVSKIENTNTTNVFNQYRFDSTGVVVEDKSLNNPVNNYVFDENGFVVQDTNQANEYEKDTSNQTASNNEYVFDENGMVISDGSAKPTSNYTFDENGVVISDESQAPTSNYVFDENGVVVSDGSQAPTSNYTFDENGVVVSDGSTNNTPVEQTTQRAEISEEFQFDENGNFVG